MYLVTSWGDALDAEIQVKGILRLSPSIHGGIPLIPQGIPLWYLYSRYTGAVVAGVILLGFVSLGRLWFRRRFAGTFSLPVGETSNARGPSPGSKTGLPLQCTRLDTGLLPKPSRVVTCLRGRSFPMQGNDDPDSSACKNPFKRFPGCDPLPEPIDTHPEGTHVISPPGIPTLGDPLLCGGGCRSLVPHSRSANSTGRWRSLSESSRRRVVPVSDGLSCFGVFRSGAQWSALL